MANEAMAAHLGYDRAEIVGSEPARFMPEADVEEGQHSSVTCLATTSDRGRLAIGRNPRTGRSGSPRRSATLFDEEGLDARPV